MVHRLSEVEKGFEEFYSKTIENSSISDAKIDHTLRKVSPEPADYGPQIAVIVAAFPALKFIYRLLSHFQQRTGMRKLRRQAATQKTETGTKLNPFPPIITPLTMFCTPAAM